VGGCWPRGRVAWCAGVDGGGESAVRRVEFSVSVGVGERWEGRV
jgi:hypothetical protein